MAKIVTKQRFFDRLSWLLSFHYNGRECASILNDYEDLFVNEELQGRSEEDICLRLEEPSKIVRNLLAETGSASSKGSILLGNAVIQILLMTVLRFAAELAAYTASVEYALDYTYFAIGIQFLYFIAGVLLIRENAGMDGKRIPGEHIWIFLTAVVFLGLEVFFIPRLEEPMGEILVSFLIVLLLVLFLIGMSLSLWKIPQNKSKYFGVMFHMFGLVPMSLSLIQQLHMLHDSKIQYITAAGFRGVGLYVETIVLGLLFLVRKGRE